MTAATLDLQARPSAWRAFRAILWRDVFVTGKEFWVFAIQVALQPLFMLFVFAKVLSRAGYVSPSYGSLLLPGMVALTAFLTALQTVAFPLVMEFSWTKEIEDRLLAPLPTPLVGVEKILVAMIRSLAAALLMFPIGALVLGYAPWNPAGVPMLLLTLVLGGCVGGAIGLTIGTWMPPNRINIMFAVILVPLMFTGATQYPWKSLSTLHWFQVVTACNPLTYVSEGVRGAVVPYVPHIAPWICIAVLVLAVSVFTTVGLKGFMRRAID